MIRKFSIIFLLFSIFLMKTELLAQKFSIMIPNFTAGNSLPLKYACKEINDGQGLSPNLIFSNIPEGTKNLILIIEDPDAPNPKKPFIHLIAKLNPQMNNIPEGQIKNNAIQIIKNDKDEADYLGPCPPQSSNHSYFFTLVALKNNYDLSIHTNNYFRNTWNYKNNSQTSAFIKEVKDNTLGVAQLMGKFGNNK